MHLLAGETVDGLDHFPFFLLGQIHGNAAYFFHESFRLSGFFFATFSVSNSQVNLTCNPLFVFARHEPDIVPAFFAGLPILTDKEYVFFSQSTLANAPFCVERNFWRDRNFSRIPGDVLHSFDSFDGGTLTAYAANGRNCTTFFPYWSQFFVFFSVLLLFRHSGIFIPLQRIGNSVERQRGGRQGNGGQRAGRVFFLRKEKNCII